LAHAARGIEGQGAAVGHECDPRGCRARWRGKARSAGRNYGSGITGRLGATR
jgi:hypothetical protein